MVVVGSFIAGCEERNSDPPAVKHQAPTGPPPQLDTPAPNTSTGQGSGTRSDYQPSTGQGAREETK